MEGGGHAGCRGAGAAHRGAITKKQEERDETVPKDTSAAMVKQVHDATVKAIAMADVQQAMGRQGLEPETSTPAELAQRIKRETGQWAVVIREQGIKAE